MMRLHRYKDRQKKWRWTLYAANGRKIACAGEGYSRKAHNERMVRKLEYEAAAKPIAQAIQRGLMRMRPLVVGASPEL
jgi:uncharacterized protein YegP (UPF0339 family)